jgi:vitamin B12 transporter
VRLTAGGTAEFQELRQFTNAVYNFGAGPTPQPGADFNHTRRNVGLYAQGMIDLTSRILLNLGGRLDDNQTFGTHATVRAGSVIALGQGLRARGSVGTAFKEPSLRENFINDPFEIGDTLLKPEQSTSWELGLEQSLAGGLATVAATYFDQRFRDLIQYDAGAPVGAPNYRNIARATSRGLELSANVRPMQALTLGASYTWLTTNVDDAGFASAVGGVFENGKPLIRRPSHSLRLDGRARLRERLSLGAAVTYAGQRDDVDFSTFPSTRTTLPSYTLVDADAALDLIRPAAGRFGLTATVKVENLFDASYQTVVGFRGRQRGIFGGARVVF